MFRKFILAVCLIGIANPAFAAGRGYLGVWFGVASVREGRLPAGVAVNKVFPGSAAQQAGLKPGQIVLKIDGVPVRDPKTAVSLVSENAAGEKVWLTVMDMTGGGARQREVVATLAASPPGGFASIMTAKRLPRRHASVPGSSARLCAGSARVTNPSCRAETSEH